VHFFSAVCLANDDELQFLISLFGVLLRNPGPYYIDCGLNRVGRQ